MILGVQELLVVLGRAEWIGERPSDRYLQPYIPVLSCLSFVFGCTSNLKSASGKRHKSEQFHGKRGCRDSRTVDRASNSATGCWQDLPDLWRKSVTKRAIAIFAALFMSVYTLAHAQAPA